MDQLLKKWNEWWLTNQVAPERKRILRSQKLKELALLLTPIEILVLTGVRRAGKSTLIFQLINYLLENQTKPENILYFNLDEPLEEKNVKVLEKIFKTYLELKNPAGKIYLFFDEIQNISKWDSWLKTQYDFFGAKVKFIITGSNSSLMREKLSSKLSGRTLVENIYPLSFTEFLTFHDFEPRDLDLDEPKIKHYLRLFFQKGGFPEAVLEKDEATRERRLQDYFDSILFRDVVAAKKIRETAKMKDLASFTLTNMANLISYAKISRQAKLNLQSVKEYLSFLEEAYLIFQLKFFSHSVNESRSDQKAKKIYCVDHALRQAAAFTFSPDFGRVAENIVFLELKRRDKEIYYWHAQSEVDFVVKNKDHSLDLINVAYADEIPPRELKGFEQFPQKSKVRKKTVITANLEKKNEELNYIPLNKFLLTS